jgi:tetratricopeptide (TPR) repeat protein
VSARAIVVAAALLQALHPQHRVPSVPQELLERPIGLQTGIGKASDLVSTASPKAQALYDQGLTYLHSYAWIDAARSFHDALRVDATLALAYVGLSFAYEEVNKPAAARTALDRARALASAVSDHERRHIENRVVQLGGTLDAYRAALDAAIAAFPADLEFQLQRGIAEAPDPADRGQGSTGSSVPFYQRVLAAQPDHVAAHHYLTHAYENAGRTADALSHAERYAALAPAIAHAHHMRGHDLRRVGRIDEAIAAFRRAHALETDPARTDDVPPEYDWHHQHNLDLLAASHQYLGQMREAERLMRRSFAIASPLVVQEFNRHEWPAFLLALGRIDEALEAAEALTRSPAAVARGMGHVMAGRTLLSTGRIGDAAAASNRALDVFRTTGPEGSLAAPHLQALQAEILLRTGDAAAAAQRFREARRKFRALPGPDGWSQALFRLDSIGRAAVRAGAWQIAAETAADLLEHDPAYGGTQYLRALVAEHEGDHEKAGRALADAERAWRAADADYPDLLDVRARLERRRQTGRR